MKRINISNLIKVDAEITRARVAFDLAKKKYEKVQQTEGVRPDTIEKWRVDMEEKAKPYNEALMNSVAMGGKIQNEIDLAEGKARVRMIRVRDITDTVETIKARFNTTMKAMEGAVFSVDVNAQDFPKAYKGRPESTWFKLEVSGGKWYLTDIWRDDTAKWGQGIKATLTEDLKKAILEQYRCF